VRRLLDRPLLLAIPALIALASCLALLTWDREFQTAPAVSLPLVVVEETVPLSTPAEAWARLQTAPFTVPFKDTRLSQRPFWFSFTVPAVGPSVAVELPSRHALETACWRLPNLEPLGLSSRAGPSSGSMRLAKAGTVVELGRLEQPQSILCKASHAGPARISALAWTAPQLETSRDKFHRDSGLLDGGLLVLALFVLTTAIINREPLYVFFAAWLVANLRMAALSAGWDTHWLERTVPDHWLLPMRKYTIAAYYSLTFILFSRLLKDELARVGWTPVLRFAQWSCLAMVALAIALPFSTFLPWMWMLATVSIGALAVLLGRILLLAPSAVAMWYGASIGLALAVGLYEIVAASLGHKALIGAVNSVTAALASSLLAALAIAEQIRQERRQRLRAQAELRHAYEAIPIGLFTLDHDGRFALSNPALRSMLGVQGSELAPWRDYFEPGAWERLQALIAADSNRHEMELRSTHLAGSEPKVFLVKAALAGRRIEGSLQDITTTVRATERLRFFADHDPLTGILNRRGIEQALEQVMTARPGQPLALAYLDLDRFKLINDLYGHRAGDQILRQVCDRVRQAAGSDPQLGRVGGDEFVIVFADTPVGLAADICRTIIEEVGAAPYSLEQRAFQVRVSIGLVEVPGGVALKDLLAVADRACREVKNGRQPNPAVYRRDAAVFREQTDELRLVERLGAQVVPEGLFLAMQPIMCLRAPEEALDFEVLLRMREHDGSVTTAERIIAAAESNGRVSMIDRWVLDQLLEWLAAHDRELAKTRFVCVNLSAGSLNDERFVQDAFAMLAGAGRLSQRLCIEITESVALHDLSNTRRFIDRLRGFGTRVALDDFGAGYTSFSYLRELPADAIKIAGTFVQGATRHPANLAIVEAITDLARNLGMKSVAEWVEDSATVEVLARIGVDYLQGFVVGRPQPPGKILLAKSAASFIEDEAVRRFVRQALSAGSSSRRNLDGLGSAPKTTTIVS